jgi:ATP-dependent Clp protease, protease subunit
VARINRDSVDKLHDYNLHLETRTIYIGAMHGPEGYDADEISPVTALNVIKNLAILDAQSSQPINIVINSEGGDVYPALAIYDAIRRCNSEVHILATGYCMSAATIILQAGTVRKATPHCVLMVHDGQDTLSGTPEDVMRWSKLSARTTTTMHHIYASRSGKPASYWKAKCKQDYILSATESLEEKLIDEIVE